MEKKINFDFDEVRDRKIEEAQAFFAKLGIKEPNTEPFLLGKDYSENSGDLIENEKETKFHWTRLSINSTIGCIIE